MLSHFMCAVKITNVEENGNWGYISCIGCVEEDCKQEGKYNAIVVLTARWQEKGLTS